MAVPRGVTLIVGGGFHGKSTLLQALEVGVYDHIPTDGREFVVADPNAVKVRAEDGRPIVRRAMRCDAMRASEREIERSRQIEIDCKR
eukprot:SAG22_NODE_355_length_11775_cov_76.400651_9_plen_88_part_00